MSGRPPSLKPEQHVFSGAALVVVLLLLAIQVYLFETVLSSSLDGERGLLQGAFWVSAALSAVALWLAFRAPHMDDPR